MPGNPDLWRIVDGELYLNLTRNVVVFREADIAGNVAMSEANWPTLEHAQAADGAIPEYATDAPVE